MQRHTIIAVIGGLLLATSITFGEDWPQWRGPHRDGKSRETGLLKHWPEAGPTMLWSYDDLGHGYSSVSIVSDTIYTTGAVDKIGYLYALGLDGKFKWKVKYGSELNRGYNGSRTTPTIVDGLIYVMSDAGDITCISVKKQKKVWGFNALIKFNGKNPRWNIAESVLVDGDNVICTPGGPDASVVALNRKTGETVWTSKGHSDTSSYCSPLLVREDKKDLIVTCTSKTVVALAPKTGEILWREPIKNMYSIHPNTPIYWKGCLYITTGYDGKGFLLELSDDGKKVKRKWEDSKLNTHHGGVVRIGDYVYGTNHRGRWICLSLKTGKAQYEVKGIGKGSLTSAEGMLYCYAEKRGTVALVRADPKKYDVVSQFKITKGKAQHWAHPVVCGGRLYIRYEKVLMAFDIKAK